MSGFLKQRLLGLLVIILLILTFVPVVFQQPPFFLREATIVIPEVPDVKPPALLFEPLSDTALELTDHISTARQQALSSLHHTEVPSKLKASEGGRSVENANNMVEPTESLEQPFLAPAWTVQLLRHISRQVLLEAQAGLIKLEMPAYVTVFSDKNDGVLSYGLYVGPEISKQNAQRHLEQLLKLQKTGKLSDHLVHAQFSLQAYVPEL